MIQPEDAIVEITVRCPGCNRNQIHEIVNHDWRRFVQLGSQAHKLGLRFDCTRCDQTIEVDLGVTL